MQIHGGNITEISRKYNLKESEIKDFSSNVNPLGFPSSVRTLLAREAKKITRYPDSHSTELKEEIARRHGIHEKTIMVGNGSTELIYLIPRVCKPKCALIPLPTFCDYQRSLLSVGCEVRYLPLKEQDHFRVNSGKVIDLLSKVDMVWLCNPNNPTGSLLTRDKIVYLSAQAKRKGVLLVVDEAFMDFSAQESVIAEVGERENLLVIKSLTKFFGIPGLRLGYVIANAKLIEKMDSYKEPWTVNVLAQKVGIACLRDEQFTLKTIHYVKRERQYLLRELSKFKGLKPYGSSTNYLLVKIVKPGLSSGKLYEELAQQGILIRDCRSFGVLDDKFIRVAVKKRKDNMLLIKYLRRIVEQ